MKHISPHDLSRLRGLLDERERALREDIRRLLLESDDQHHKDLAGMVADPGDESVANLLVDLDVAFIDRHIHELREIEAARGRMAAGDYGICTGCAGEIELERLFAFPEATRCTRCQAQYEKTYAQAGASGL